MRILILTHNFLDGFGGGAYGARAYINAFAALYEDVTLLYPSRTREEALPSVAPSIRKRPVVDLRSKWKKIWDLRMRGILHRYEKVFMEILEKEHFDVIVFQNSKSSSRLIPLAKAHGARVVVIHDNFELEYTRDNALLPEWILQRRAIRKTESDAIQLADLNLVLTQQDDQLFRQVYAPSAQAEIQVLGAFEFQHREDLDWPLVDTPTFLITGNLGVRQTVESLLPWLDGCWPLVKAHIPEARLIVAGKNPSAGLRQRIAAAGAELVDTPPDMDAVLARGRFFVCPVSKGGGIKLRVMDGLRAGLPALVHEVSARGYEAFQGLALFTYHNPDSFGKALETMLSTPIERKTVQGLFREQFSFEAGVARLKKILSRYAWS